VSLSEVIGELNQFLTGWVNYYRHAACKGHLQRMDAWIRRKLTFAIAFVWKIHAAWLNRSAANALRVTWLC